MLRVHQKLAYLLLAMVACANLLSIDLGHNHRPHVDSVAPSSTCSHACHQHLQQRPADDRRHETPAPGQPCHDDDCVACRYLAQLQVIQVCLTSEFEIEFVEKVVPRSSLPLALTSVLCHHSRAPPFSVA